MYRISFGNGYWRGYWSALTDAKREYTELAKQARAKGDPWFGYIQHRVDNEWRRVRLECEES